MLKQFNVTFWEYLVKDRGAVVISRNVQDEILRRAKNVRSVDYIAPFNIVNGEANTRDIVTRAKWRFILTNASCFFENMSAADFPKIAVNFPYFVPKSPFNTPAEDVGAVPASIVFGREGLTGKMQHFEEQKNLYYTLDQRFVIEIDLKAKAGQYGRGYVLLSGLEVDISGV